MWLAQHDIQYIIRLPRNFNKEVDRFFMSGEKSTDVQVNMSDVNWRYKGMKSVRSFGMDPEKCPPVMLHLVKCTLSTGETEVLAVRIKGRGD